MRIQTCQNSFCRVTNHWPTRKLSYACRRTVTCPLSIPVKPGVQRRVETAPVLSLLLPGRIVRLFHLWTDGWPVLFLLKFQFELSNSQSSPLLQGFPTNIHHFFRWTSSYLPTMSSSFRVSLFFDIKIWTGDRDTLLLLLLTPLCGICTSGLAGSPFCSVASAF